MFVTPTCVHLSAPYCSWWGCIGCWPLCGLKSSLHWCLYFVDALLFGGDRKSIVRWCYPPLLPFLFKDSSLWMVSDDGTWSPDALEVFPSALREVVISDEFWFVYLLLSLVPILLVRPQMEVAGGRRSYEGWWRVQRLRQNRQVCCSVVVLTNDRWVSIGCVIPCPCIGCEQCDVPLVLYSFLSFVSFFWAMPIRPFGGQCL
jgi:hypothetical protein